MNYILPEKYLPNVFGMRHDNNLCYFATLIQALISCPSFNENMLINNHNNEFHKYFILFILEALKSSEDNKPLNFSEASIKLSNLLGIHNGSQEDLLEFFTTFMEKMDKLMLFKICYKGIIICRNCNKYKSIPKNFISHVRVHGDADFRSQIINPTDEKLSDYVCDNCRQSTQIFKKFQIYGVPKILMLIIDKGTKEVPEQIVFKSIKKIYKLCSIIHHSGSSDFGHYNLSCKRLNGTYIINGNHYEKIPELITNGNSHILLYDEKIN